MSYHLSHSYLNLNSRRGRLGRGIGGSIPWHFAIITWAKFNNINIHENTTERDNEYYEFENFSDYAYLKLVWDNEFAERWYTEYLNNPDSPYFDRIDTNADPRQLSIPFD